MFALREITEDHRVTNTVLGRKYSAITKTDSNNQFADSSGLLFHVHPDELQNTYAFVSDEDGKLIPLFKDRWYYIVTGSGTTYENLSQKGLTLLKLIIFQMRRGLHCKKMRPTVLNL